MIWCGSSIIEFGQHAVYGCLREGKPSEALAIDWPAFCGCVALPLSTCSLGSGPARIDLPTLARRYSLFLLSIRGDRNAALP